MPPITLSSISSSNVKVRWKEPYASEGLNRKLAVVVPSGVYRGLKLGVSTTNLSVDLVTDVAGDHVAIHENQLGFSTTYVDDTSGTITLPLSGFLANEVVVICLVVTYTSGSSTTALFRGYELSEYEALSSAAKQDLVVLGTVLRPASGIIPAGNITHDRRKLPFLQRTDESTPWNPLIRNGGFELGQTNGTYRHASPFWTTTTTNANFTIRPVITEFRSGAKSLEMTTTTVGAVIATIQQDLWMPVTPGRFIMGRLYKKALLAPSVGPAPTARMRFVFGDLDGINDVNEDLLFDISAVDGSFEENGGIVKVPVTARVLKSVQIIMDATYAGTGPCIRIDDVQAWAQVDGANWLDVQDSRVRETAVGDLFLGAANSFGNNSAQLSFDGTLLSIERRDGLQTSLPPALAINGRVYTSKKLTLLFQSAIPLPLSGLTIYYRKYVNSLTFGLVETVNASYDNGTSNWSKDVTFAMVGSAVEATKHDISYTGVKIYGRGGSVADDTPWNETGWKEYVATAVPEVATVANPKFAPILATKDAGGNRKVIVDHNGLLMGRQAMMNETWWRADPALSPALDLKSWIRAGTGGGSESIGQYGICRIDPGAGANKFESIYTSNDQFIPMGDSNLIVTAEWEWSPNNVNVVLPTCKVAMGFFSGGVISGVSSEGLWLGVRETDTNWQFGSQKFGGTGTFWTDAAGAFGDLVDTGVPHTSLATRLRIEVYGAHSSFGTARALAYINGALVGEIAGADLPSFNVGWGMEINRVIIGGTRSMSIGPLKIVHNRRVRSDDAL